MLIAGRADGLGARLFSVFNALSIARLHGQERIGVWWPTLGPTTPQSLRKTVGEVGALEELLAPEVIKHIDWHDAEATEVAFNPAEAAAQATSTEPVGFKYPNGILCLPQETPAEAAARFRSHINSAVLHPRLQAVEMALRSELAGRVAVHIRRGDLLRFRLFGLQFLHTKYLTRLRFEEVVETAGAEGVVVFTDSRPRLRAYETDERILFGEDLIPEGLTRAQANLAEILAMASCSKVYAASTSMFSGLASAWASLDFVAGECDETLVERSYQHPPAGAEWVLDTIAVAMALLAEGRADDASEHLRARPNLFPEAHLGLLLHVLLARRSLLDDHAWRSWAEKLFDAEANERCLAEFEADKLAEHVHAVRTAARLVAPRELPSGGMRSLFEAFVDRCAP